MHTPPVDITPDALFQLLKESSDLLLIDVRTIAEREQFNIGGMHVPMEDINRSIEEIRNAKSVIFYCEKGIRSMIVIQRLQEKYGFNHLVNLQGGMKAWKKEIPQQ